MSFVPVSREYHRSGATAEARRLSSGESSHTGTPATSREGSSHLDQMAWETAAWLALEGWPVLEERSEWSRTTWVGANVVSASNGIPNQTASTDRELSNGIVERPFRYEDSL